MWKKITETFRVKIKFEFFVRNKPFFCGNRHSWGELHVSLFTSGKAELCNFCVTAL